MQGPTPYPNQMAPLIIDEMNVDFVQYIMNLICPIREIVLDPMAGTMDSSTACLKTKREGVSLEIDIDCFRYVV